jgi:hypothetical protein
VHDGKGNTALWQAVSNQHIEAVEVLIFEVGVDPDAQCELGNTVLHKALMIDSVLAPDKTTKMDKILSILSERCNIRKLNWEWQTPIFFATLKRTQQFFWLKEVSQVVDQ